MTGRLSVRYSALDSDIITMDPQNDSKPTKGWKIGYFLSGLRRRHFAIYGTGFVCLVAVIFAVTFSVLLRRSGNQPVADLGYARYRGVAGSNGVSQWLGVRYAAAPVGDLRFAEPHDPPATNDTQDATKFRSSCISVGQYPIPSSQDEDCLFVNIFAPTTVAAGQKLPVYFFIQGGGFSSLSNPQLNGNGLVVASGMNIVVVTLNYRVGPYGFLSSQEVEQEASLNNGLKDIIQALKWVQTHIGTFGGDPSHVTLGGASAGAGAVTLLLSAYGGRLGGLFQAAIAESQSFATMLTVEESQFIYNNLTIRTGCNKESNSLACLRNLDLDTFQKENIGIPYPQTRKRPIYLYGPIVDGTLVKNLTAELFQEGQFLKLPVIFGDDTNEGTIFVPRNVSDPAEGLTFMQDQFPYMTSTELQWFNKTYLSEPDPQPYTNAGRYWGVTSTGYGETRYICPGISLSNAYTSYGISNTWNYHYAVLDSNSSSGYGTRHVIELSAIWGPDNVDHIAPPSYFTTNAAIVPVMQGYWTSFIRSYNPNTYRYPDSPQWGTWGANYSRLFIRTDDTKMELVPDDQMERCKYLTSIEQDLRQ